MGGRWLTPSVPPPAARRCRRLRIPDSVEWIALVSGALDLLCFEGNFQQNSAVNPNECAQTFRQMLLEYNVEIGCMTGEIFAWPNIAAPEFSLLCDGSTYLRVDYPDLYAVLDGVYHADADHFVVPDLRDRFVVGAGNTYARNDVGGESTHVLTVAELASHYHVSNNHVHVTGNNGLLLITAPPVGPIPVVVPGAGNTAGPTDFQYSSTGSSNAHNNLPPYRALTYCIRTG